MPKTPNAKQLLDTYWLHTVRSLLNPPNFFGTARFPLSFSPLTVPHLSVAAPFVLLLPPCSPQPWPVLSLFVGPQPLPSPIFNLALWFRNPAFAATDRPLLPRPSQLLGMVGEQFTEGDEICGVVVSVRNKQDRVAIWTKTASNEAAQVCPSLASHPSFSFLSSLALPPSLPPSVSQAPV